VGLAQGDEVVQAGGPALAPGGEVVDVAPGGRGLTGREDAGPVAGAHQVDQTRRGTVPGAAHVHDGAADRVGHQAPPGAAGGQGPGSHSRHRRAARPDLHLRNLSRRGGQRGGGSSRGGSRQTPPARAGQSPPAGGGQASSAAWGCCAVERLGRSSGVLARAGSAGFKAAGGVGTLTAPRATASRTTVPGMTSLWGAVVEPVALGSGAGVVAAGIVCGRRVIGGVFYLCQAAWVGEAVQGDGDLDVDVDASGQGEVSGA